MEFRVPGMLQKEVPDWLPLECYTEYDVLAGRVRWPIGLRLLDLLNSLYATKHDSSGDFFDFIDISGTGEPVCTYVSKEAMQMVTVSQPELGRGVGADPSRPYPFVSKSGVLVAVRLKTYILNGYMHLSENESIQHLLNRDALFVPVTNATIFTPENRYYGDRPFVAVNKRHIILVRVEEETT
jgi:hypothetical protein